MMHHMDELEAAYAELKVAADLERRAMYERLNALKASRHGSHDVARKNMRAAERMDRKAAAVRAAAQKIIDCY